MLADSGTVPAVFVLGRHTDLLEAILEEFRRAGDIAIYGGTLSVSAIAAGPRGAERPELEANAESVLVLIDDEMVESLFRDPDSRRTKKLLRSGEDQISEFVTDTVVGVDAQRLLVLCDARSASPSEKSQAIRWVRQLTVRIGYECSINGTDDLTTTYEVVVNDADVQRTARSIALWHADRLTPQQERPPAVCVGT
ncbi:hypothetical protein [[Mycobacterium] burgundiense]|jgi:hypothetical protein|uniref:Uncharacterized protein n=1 Tax=[Mycobacterium] burgundiense TaxID=3064286 RepID=A0ABM9LQA7_9MYCO|nr:hypothetical protein [Mycolicibacterium sp. MU0053]CAJ1502877.1 hypothetical protein MU0053_002296 [Mycolicibacterium sp. MU0053]